DIIHETETDTFSSDGVPTVTGQSVLVAFNNGHGFDPAVRTLMHVEKSTGVFNVYPTRLNPPGCRDILQRGGFDFVDGDGDGIPDIRSQTQIAFGTGFTFGVNSALNVGVVANGNGTSGDLDLTGDGVPDHFSLLAGTPARTAVDYWTPGD